ncbi:MAG: mechanosensitive ion channel [Curvibacter sp.]|nr:mechanosensitive ion channel [Curvibacter sp.]
MQFEFLIRLGMAVLGTALYLGLLWATWHGVDRLRHWLDAPALADEGLASEPAAALPGWMPYLRTLLARILQLLGLFVSAGLSFGWLTSVLLSFEATESLGRRLGGLLSAALATVGNGLVDTVPGLIVVAVIVVLAQAAVQASNTMFQAVARRQLKLSFIHPETASATRRLVALGIWALAVVAAYPYLPGAQSEVFKGVSVLLGAMLTLGSSGVVTQLMSGLVLVYSRALRVGDHVVSGHGADAVEGVVQQVGVLATKLVNVRNEEITIPNAVLVNNAIKNYSRLSERSGTLFSAHLSIGYDAPWRQVHALLLQAAEKTPRLRREPRPYVLQRALSDFYVEYELLVHLDRPLERTQVLSNLHENIQDAFNEAGVQIMSPHFLSQPDKAVLARRDAAD